MARKTENRYGEFGKTGLPVYSGRVYDEIDKKMTPERWRRSVREMSETDSSIGAFLFVIEMIARQVEWSIVPFAETPEDEDLALFVRQCLFEDMQQTWQNTVAEILSFVPWGWSWFEIVYKRRRGQSRDKTKNSKFTDGRVGWRKWAIRSQESLFEWEFDEWDEVTAMVQMPEPDFQIRRIPVEKSLHFRLSAHKQNPEGRSILRRAYRDFYFKRHIENIEGIGIERELAGLPKIGAPPEIFKETATTDEKQLLQYLNDLGSKVRQDEVGYVLYPLEYDGKGNKRFDFELLTSGGERAIDIAAAIDRHDQRMLMTAMADFLLLGSKETGSYALSDTKLRTFLKSIKTFLDSICDTVNQQAIPPLLRLNGKSSDRAPYLEAGTLDDITIEQLGSYIETLVKAGVAFNDEEKTYLKGRANIPVDAEKTPGAETKEVDPNETEGDPVDNEEDDEPRDEQS